MDTWLVNIPSELITIISYYLDYSYTLVLRNLFNIEINYLTLLSEKYPGASLIVRQLKLKDKKYQYVSYDEIYKLIERSDLELSMSYPDRTFRSDDISWLIKNYAYNVELLNDYNLLDSQFDEIYKYKYYFSYLNDNSNTIYSVFLTYIQYKSHFGNILLKSTQIQNFIYNNNNLHNIIFGSNIKKLLFLYLLILDQPDSIDYVESILSSIDHGGYTDDILTRQYIEKYINNRKRKTTS